MKLYIRYVLGALLVSALITFALLFATEQNIAHAQSTGLGTQIVCLVYHDLSPFTPPEPESLQNVSVCQSTSTPSGAGNLEIIKRVNGGPSVSSDFEIHVASGGTELAGSPEPGSSTGVTFIGLAVSNYTVSETGATATQYSSSFSGNCSASGAVFVAAGATAVCTLTNTFIGTSTAPGANGTLTGTVNSTTTSTTTLSGTVGGG
ncbi:MAG TPA: hypothetical protein VG102_03800, partial [Candidatus Paceibacterota bacterium]|nr:hypothetical protein [Candidatus Paceibacterota bacterium]